MTTMHTEVLRAMPPGPAELSAKQIHQRVGQGALRTIKHTLAALAEAGQVIRNGDEMPTYRRAA